MFSAIHFLTPSANLVLLGKQFTACFACGGGSTASQQILNDLHFEMFGSFAEVFSAEANELGCQTRSFDPDAYYEFINGQCAIGNG